MPNVPGITGTSVPQLPPPPTAHAQTLPPPAIADRLGSPGSSQGRASRDAASVRLLLQRSSATSTGATTVDTAPPDARESMLAWAEKTYERFIIQDGQKFLAEQARSEDGRLLHRTEIVEKIKRVAYRIYRDVHDGQLASTDLSIPQQRKLVEDLVELADSAGCRVALQDRRHNSAVARMQPLDALERDEVSTLAHALFVRPTDVESRANPLGHGTEARLTLNPNVADIASVSKQLMALLATFSDFIVQFKVLPPAQLGRRTDHIVVYLNRADVDRANKLAQLIADMDLQKPWLPYIPAGMEPKHRGIAYSEFGRATTSSSHGMERARLIAEAVIDHIDLELEMDKALNLALTSHAYSVSNPARLMFN